MDRLLETCPPEEIYSALGGSEGLLVELQENLQNWLGLQPHLPQDVPPYLLKYLIVHTKFSLELAKQKLDMYYTVRRLVPEFFSNRDPMSPNIQLLRETTQWVPLPKLTPEKYRVTVYRKLTSDLEKYNLCDDMKYVFMTSDIRMSECNCLGEIYIYDLSQICLGHMTKITPGIVKKAVVVITTAYAAGIKGIHMINAPSFVTQILHLLKSVLSTKLAERVHVHTSGYESLYEFIPKSILPEEYGGNEVSLVKLSKLWHEKLYEWRHWFLEQESVMADESRRPGPIVNGDDLFGFSGSFRQMEYD